MATTLEDLYVHPKFVEKVERPIKAKIMSWTFPTDDGSAARPTAVTLNSVKFSDEDEERIQGEVVVSARMSVNATVTTTEDINQTFEGFMNFSLPWGWQARDARFVAESAQVALNDLRRL
jgi:hypothetical protein